jgi:ribosomal protein L29
MLTKQEIRQMTDKDLQSEIAKTTRELMKINMDIEGSQTKGTHKKRQLRRYVARLKTIEKEFQKEDKLAESKKEKEPSTTNK